MCRMNHANIHAKHHSSLSDVVSEPAPNPQTELSFGSLCLTVFTFFVDIDFFLHFILLLLSLFFFLRSFRANHAEFLEVYPGLTVLRSLSSRSADIWRPSPTPNLLDLLLMKRRSQRKCLDQTEGRRQLPSWISHEEVSHEAQHFASFAHRHHLQQALGPCLTSFQTETDAKCNPRPFTFTKKVITLPIYPP